MSKPRDTGPQVVAFEIEREEAEDHGTSLTKELSHVEEANLAFYEAFMRRDVDRMADLWAKSPHVRCVHPGWELVVGWDDVRASWQEILRSVQAVEFRLEDVHVEVTGNTAWVNLLAYVSLDTEEGDQFQATVVTTNILENFEGRWLFVLHHSSNFVEEEDVGDDDDSLDFDDDEPSDFGDLN